MTYRVNYTDDTKSPIIVQDGDVDTSTNIGLVGRGYTGFGEVVAENFLHLLENFSDETPPARPVEGQLWYNNTNSSMYYYTVSETWKKIGNVRTESFDPILNDGEVNGDLWLNTSTNDLYIYSSPNWVLMANGDISTKVYTRTRKDTQGNAHKTIEVVVANKVVAVFSSDVTPWTPNSTGSDTETLDDGSVMADIYSSIKLGINLVNRKSITEVTVSTTNPTAGTTSQYVQEGDMWVNKTSNRLYTYTNSSWKRINNYVKVRAAVPVIENDEQSGDLWINTLNDKIYYYNPTTSSWEFLASNTTFSTISPTSTDIRNIGDYWINTEKLKLYAYDGSNWLDLTFQEKGTFVRSVVRKDINNVDHKVLETIVNGKTVSVDVSDDYPWKPNTSEILYEGGSYYEKFPYIIPGINMSNYVGEITITTNGGDIELYTESSPRLLNGIATKRSLSGAYFQNFEDYTVTTDFTDVNTVSVYLYPLQWVPLIKGQIQFVMVLNGITTFEYRILRRPLDSTGNTLDERILYKSSVTYSSAKSTVEIFVLPFIDNIGPRLYEYYPVGSQGPYQVRYALQIKRGAAGSFVVGNTVLDLEPIFLGWNGSADSTDTADFYSNDEGYNP